MLLFYIELEWKNIYPESAFYARVYGEYCLAKEVGPVFLFISIST